MASITIGIYDLFSYTLPGVFYLYIFFEFARLLDLPALNMENFKDVELVLLVGLAIPAYFVGQIMESISYRFWYGIVYKVDVCNTVLQQIRGMFPDLKIKFESHQAVILSSFVGHQDLERINYIEKLEVYFVMLHNIAFALILFSLL